MTGRVRREHPSPLPGIAHVRITAADNDTAKRILDVLGAYFVTTAPADYSGGRVYLDVDTRSQVPAYPEAD